MKKLLGAECMSFTAHNGGGEKINVVFPDAVYAEIEKVADYSGISKAEVVRQLVLAVLMLGDGLPEKGWYKEDV